VRRTNVLAATLVAVAALSSCNRSRPDTEPVPSGGIGVRATVIEVVDGDTLDVRIGGQRERLRLLGIDTPETVKPDSPVECFGPEASAYAGELLPPGTDVLLQRDRQARDRFGRLLAYLWRASDGRFVNEAMLAGGYARLLVIEPNTVRRPALAAAASEARAARVGLWGSCPPSEPGR
jgi:micrococcal nuclease